MKKNVAKRPPDGEKGPSHGEKLKLVHLYKEKNVAKRHPYGENVSKKAPHITNKIWGGFFKGGDGLLLPPPLPSRRPSPLLFPPLETSDHALQSVTPGAYAGFLRGGPTLKFLGFWIYMPQSVMSRAAVTVGLITRIGGVWGHAPQENF